MAIIETQIQIQKPVVLSLAQQQIRAKANITTKIKVLYQNMIMTYNASMNQVWSNVDGLTPQEVFDAFGTDGAELLRLADILRRAINEATPNAIPDATASFKVDNGKVTVS